MKISINRKWIFLLFIMLGILSGFVFDWVSSFISKGGLTPTKQVAEYPPVYGSSEQHLIFNDNLGKLYALQGRVLGYQWKNGVYYMILGYELPAPSDSKSFEKHSVMVILSRETEWSLDKEGIDKEVFEALVWPDVKVRESLANAKLEYHTSSIVFTKDFEKKFPVGTHIALAIASNFDNVDSRYDDERCTTSNLCDYIKIWEVLSPSESLEDFYISRKAFDDGVVLFPYDISPAVVY